MVLDMNEIRKTAPAGQIGKPDKVLDPRHPDRSGKPGH